MLRCSLASTSSSQSLNDEIPFDVVHEPSVPLKDIMGSILWVLSRVAYLNVEDPAALDQAPAAQAHLQLIRSTSRFFLNFETLKLLRQRMCEVEATRAAGLRLDPKPLVIIVYTEHPCSFSDVPVQELTASSRVLCRTLGPLHVSVSSLIVKTSI